MSHENIIRAWKDAEFRNSLSEKERSLLPENPAGLLELTDTELNGAVGGRPYTKPPACDPPYTDPDIDRCGGGTDGGRSYAGPCHTDGGCGGTVWC